MLKIKVDVWSADRLTAPRKTVFWLFHEKLLFWNFFGLHFPNKQESCQLYLRGRIPATLLHTVQFLTTMFNICATPFLKLSHNGELGKIFKIFTFASLLSSIITNFPQFPHDWEKIYRKCTWRIAVGATARNVNTTRRKRLGKLLYFLKSFEFTLENPQDTSILSPSFAVI